MITISKNEFVEAIAKEFVHSETTSEALYHSFKTRNHIILWGPGGHGKSDIAEAGIKLITDPEKFYAETFIASCSEQMDASPFVGYTNIKKLRDEGKRVTVLDDTVFLQARYAILEEGFDAPDSLLLSLKDGLQRGHICINGVCQPNKLETLIICTNVDPGAWAGKDMSRNALLGRFAFSHEVKWPAYKAKNFNDMFSMRGGSDLVVSRMAEICHEQGFLISPRDAMKMKVIFHTGGIEALRTFRGITPPAFKALQDFQSSLPYVKQLEELEALLELAANAPDQHTMLKKLAEAQNASKKITKVPTEGTYSGRLKDALNTMSIMKDQAINRASKTIIL